MQSEIEYTWVAKRIVILGNHCLLMRTQYRLLFSVGRVSTIWHLRCHLVKHPLSIVEEAIGTCERLLPPPRAVPTRDGTTLGKGAVGMQSRQCCFMVCMYAYLHVRPTSNGPKQSLMADKRTASLSGAKEV